MTSGPDGIVEWIRFTNAMAGCAAFGLMLYRLAGHWDGLSWLSRAVVGLLAAAVLVLGLGAARAAAIDAPFNELAWFALAVNLGTCGLGITWHRWPDPTGRKR